MKTILLILLALTITTLNLKAEKLTGNARLDSLIADLPNAQGDTNEVKLLNNLSSEYKNVDPDKGIKFGEQGLKLAKKINWEKGEAYSYNSLAINNTVKSNYPKALEYYNKALKIMEELGNKNGIASTLGNMGIIYNNQSDYPKALEYYNKALKIMEELGNKNGIASTLGNMGSVYQRQSKYPKALEYYGKALKIYEDIGNKNGIAANLVNMGLVYSSQSDYPKALEYYNKALKIMEELGNKNGIAVILGNMGGVYVGQSNYPKALEYYGKALKIYEDIGNKKGIAFNFGSMGLVYNNQSDYPKALEYYNKALKIMEELGNKRGVAANLGNMGGIYQYQSDYPKALEYYGKALKMNEEIGDKSGIATNLGNIGNIYQYQSDYPKALEYYNKALKMNEELGNKRSIANNLINIGNLYTKINDLDKSLNYLNRGLVLNEKIGDTRQVNYTLHMLSGNYIARAKQIDSLQSKGETSPVTSLIKKEQNYRKALEFGLRAEKLADSIGLGELKHEIYERISIAYEGMGQGNKGLEYYKKFHIRKDSVFSQENSDKIAAIEKAREDDLNRKEIEKQKAINAEKERINQIITYITIAGFIVLIIVLIIIYRLLKRSDKLLYNVLPVSIAKRLKKKEHPISDYFTQASIVFIDIVNFTELSKDEDPRRVVEALNKIFTKYDTISNKYGLEKIKTIGDSYMAAAGIPEVQKDNTHRAAQMALEVKEMMKDYHTADGTKIEVRIGLDCGPVVAGVIGENKFIYDMWSDAVNTASRMESSSIAGEVHVSERFKEAVTEYEEFSYVERGEIEIKGKGKMKTFFMGTKKLEV